MNYIGKFLTNFKDFYKEINSATLTGAIDVVIVKQADGTYLCSPFHVRFGKIDVLRSKEKIVDIEINDEPVEIFMKLGDNGEAFFVEEWTEDNENSNSTTRVMCKKKEVEKMKLDDDEEENNLTEFNLYEKDFNEQNGLHEQLDSIEERDESAIAEKLDDINFGLTRTKSIPIAAATIHDIHPYSDGECTPFAKSSPKAEFDRPFSPKSDTEYEITRNDCNKPAVEEEFSWLWGELPQVSRKVSFASKTSDLGPNECILNHIAPNTIKEESISIDNNDETESGKDLSLPSNSPPHQETIENTDDLIMNNNNIDNNTKLNNEQTIIPIDEQPIDLQPNDLQPIDLQPTIEMQPIEIQSNDNSFITELQQTEPIEQTQVDLSIVSKHYSDLAISLCGGSNSLDDEIDDDKFIKFQVTFEKFAENSVGILQNQNLVVRLNGKFFNFQIASSFLMSVLLYQKELPADQVNRLIEQQQLLNSKKKESAASQRSSWWPWRRSYSEKSPLPKTDNLSANSPKKDKYKSTGEDGSETDLEDLDDNPIYNKKYRKSNYKKVLRLGSKDIENLNLKEGPNEVQFSVTTAYQGTSRCKCHVYLWNYDDKIIISDIDGTITKSDVLGHILPRIGRDWAQSGVANLFTKIKDNGYKMLYLSARAIGQADGTREYLKSVRQGELCLPAGPLLLSPTSLLSAFHREVIEKKPEEFKISCLKDIQTLFPFNPFYAGFGNKINDTWAYRAVGIPLYRIFTINHKGELKLELIQTFQSSYTKLTSVVDHMFPPLEDKKLSECPIEFTSFNYWRDILPEVQIEIEKEKLREEEEKKANIKPGSPQSATKK